MFSIVIREYSQNQCHPFIPCLLHKLERQCAQRLPDTAQRSASQFESGGWGGHTVLSTVCDSNLELESDMTIPTGNIIQSGIPSRTALWVATLRAVHQLLDEPIVFEDPVAIQILGNQLSNAVQQDPFQFNDSMSRGLRAALVLRSRVAEDGLNQAVQADVLQYVILGAGLDTFAYRNPYRPLGLRIFEVDHPSTQLWKKALLNEAGIAVPLFLTFAAADFETTTLKDSLSEAGFRLDQPAYFSWLGVTHYLSEKAIFNTLRFVSSLPMGTEIIFDFRIRSELLNLIDRVLNDYLAQHSATMGEPWKSAFDPPNLQAKLLKMGFRKAEDLSSAELNQRYLSRRKDGLHVGDGFRMMHAKK
jgi:methyltransferase (TIGR00027 family)